VIDASELNTLQYDPGLCTGCGMCVVVCPHAVFALNDHVALLVSLEACMECGACQGNCPTGAITVDSGVGCAAAMIRAALTGSKEVTCGSGQACTGGAE
jgi:NAD-dependent dihydropyrimidine dehydrogenase PreA subunit